MEKKVRILLIEDSEDDAKLLLRELERGGFEVFPKRVESLKDFSDALDQESWDLAISDFFLPKLTGLDVLTVFKSKKIDIPFLLVSGSVGEERAVQVMRAGAHDFIPKDNLSRLVPAVERELAESKVRERLRVSEAQFIQSQKMEGIGRLAGGVAHDFNNVLAVILMNAEAALENLEHKEVVSRAVGQVKKSADRAAGLTRQLLAFTRKQVLEFKVVDLNIVARGMKEMLHSLIGADIDLKTSFDPNLWPVKVDYGQMEQVIMNLAVNSRDAMPGGGTLSLQTENRVVDEKLSLDLGLSPGDYAVLVVKDSGFGITKEIQAKIFDPFFTTKAPGKGTGLGLSTVLGIVQQSGGHITVSSAPQEGTAFHIYLPRTVEVEESAKKEAEKSLAAQVQSRTILILEDEEELRTVLGMMLKKEGYQVLMPENSEEAIALSQEYSGQIHILLSDVVMPKMSGPDVAKVLMEMRPDLQLIFMSGYQDDKLDSQDGILKSAKFLQKPFSKNQLLEKLQEIAVG